MSKFTINNGDVLREDVVIGKVVDGKIFISDEFKNFKGPAIKALKDTLAKERPNEHPPEPSIDPNTPTMAELIEKNKKLEQEKAELLEIQADKMENNPTPEKSDESELEKENRELREKLAISNQRLIDDPRVAIEEPPFLEERDDLDNPYAIPEEMINKKVPPMPDMDWRGTKTPSCMAWLEQYYPTFAKKRFAKYNQKIKINKMREKKRKEKEEQAKKERAAYPREGGSTYPLNINDLS